MNSFHRRFARRIAFAYILISALVGGAGFVVEMVELDNMAVDLASQEVFHLATASRMLSLAPAAALDQWQDLAREILRENCLLVRSYNLEGKITHESRSPALGTMAKRLGIKMRPFQNARELVTYRFFMDGRPVVQIRIPMFGADGNPTGLLEAVYQLDPKAVAVIRAYIHRLCLAALLSTLATSLVLYPLMLSLHRRASRFSESLASANLELASVLGSAIAQRDSGTGIHNFRVTLYTIQLGVEVADPLLDMRALILGAFLHDVGKIGIHDDILLKPGPLTDEERTVMCSHIERGVAIIESSHWLDLARNVIECHHERFDGKGYPRGLEGQKIPLEARIFAIVDAFDALTSDRPYKSSTPLREAMSILHREAGGHFDPYLVSRFLEIAPAAYQEVGRATEAELQARLAEWVEAHRYFLHSDEWIPWRVRLGSQSSW